jgi:hypothetical protein
MRWCWLLLALACAKHEAGGSTSIQPQAESALTAPAEPPAPSDPIAVGTRWLDALRDADQQLLASSTLYPFELHDDGGTCEPRQMASSPDQLEPVLRCLVTDKTLLDVLRTHDSAAVEPLPGARLAAWAEKWHVSPAPGLQIVIGFFNREDARFNFDLSVEGQGVRAVWKSGVNGTREIKIAREWLDALQARDIGRLSQLTAYPFEVRDKRREALCGKRSAKGPDTLATAVDCLFRGDLLHRALVDSPSPGMTAEEPSDSLPNWIAPWWREEDHRGLQRVSTMVATVDGYEFDFQMLVARDGVRAVWKLGSFESRN